MIIVLAPLESENTTGVTASSISSLWRPKRSALPRVCVFRNSDGPTIINHQILDLTLRPGANPLQMSLALQPHQFRRATPDCVFEIHLGNRLLGVRPITHKTRRQIIAEKTASLLESLSIAGLELAVEREGESLVTDAVFATDRHLNPHFTARAEGFDDDVPGL